MPEDDKENIDLNNPQVNPEETKLLDLKNEVAQAYIDKIKKLGLSLSGLIIGKGKKLKNYLVDRDIGEFKGKLLFQPFIKPFLKEDIEYNGKIITIGDYIQEAKRELDLATTELELNNLKSKIVSNNQDQTNQTQQQNNTVPEKPNNAVTGVATTTGAAVATVATVEALDSDKRAKVIDIINKILKKDLNHPIDYTWGGRESIYKGLDCSGLIIYAFHQAKFNVPGGGDSREIFKSLQTEKVVCENDGIKNIDNVKEGDVLFWNTTNHDYDWKGGKTIPTIEKEGEKYRIHHMAFVRYIDYARGEIKIVESNGSEGVTERTINAKEVLEKTKHKSELYVGKVNYDDLLAYTPPAGTNVSNELA